jgi:hypothetical protein
MLLRTLLALVLAFPPQIFSSHATAGDGAPSNVTAKPSVSPMDTPAGPVPLSEPVANCRGGILAAAPAHVRERVLDAMDRSDARVAQLHDTVKTWIDQAEQVGEQCADKNAGECPIVGQMLEGLASVAIPLEIGLKTELAAANPHAKSFATYMVTELRSTLTKETLLAKPLFRKDVGESKRYSDARANFVKGLALALGFQLAAFGSQHGEKILSGEGLVPILASVLVPIIVNTFAMMTWQAAKGTENTTPDLGLPDPQSVAELNSQIPAMLSGVDGFVPEFKKRFAGFLALWPLEVVVISTMKVMGELFSPEGGGAAFAQQTPALIAAVSIVSMGIFGSYLATRWSVVDYMFNLRYLTRYQDLKKNIAERQTAEINNRLSTIDNELLTILEHNQVIQKPVVNSTWSFFRRAIAARGQNITQLYNEWSNERQAYSTWKSEFGQTYNEVMSAPDAGLLQAEAKRLETEKKKVRRGIATGVALEWTYRLGLNFIDAYIVFGLLGNWVPSAVQWTFNHPVLASGIGAIGVMSAILVKFFLFARNPNATATPTGG